MLIDKYCNIRNGIIHYNDSLEAYQFNKIITRNDFMLHQIERINKISESAASVVITGETGTGKELYAEYIHSTSRRKANNYVKINCATIPENLFESEVFGYEAGAFTDALKKGKKGIFEIANKGTLFLDEISELPFQMQSKLLRVLQEGSFVKIGGSTELKTDVRFVVATNKDLKRLVLEGNFREDLYYRMNVVPVDLIPLRERKEDIILLFFYYVNFFNHIYNTEKEISYTLMSSFLEYPWPGNVRELRNSVERLVLLSDGNVLTDSSVLENAQKRKKDFLNGLNDENNDFSWFRTSGLENCKTLKDMVKEYELFIILEYINRYGSLRKAAAALNTSPSVLSRKINEAKTVDFYR